MSKIRRKVNTLFGYALVIGLPLVVVWAVYQYYYVVVMPMHDDCSARGGVVVLDAFNIPTCATGPVVIQRRRN